MNNLMNIDLDDVYRKIVKEFRNTRGVLLGESAVVSQKVHSIDPCNPAIVTVHSCNDAGIVFYGRRVPGQVVHVDIFHSVGTVDHYRVAEAIKQTYETIYDGWPRSFFSILDNIDIQTGSGGGRITGKLIYGSKDSLKRAHKNHVHLCMLFVEEITKPLIHVVDAVEQVIINQGLEVRKIEKVLHNTTRGDSPVDMSPYSSDSDSALKQQGLQSSQTKEACNMRDSLELAREYGGAEQALKMLDALSNTSQIEKKLDFLNSNYGSYEEVLRQLCDKGILERHYNGLRLSAKGKELYEYLKKNLREIELNLKAFLKKLPVSEHITHGFNNNSGLNRKPGKAKPGRKTYLPQKAEWPGKVAVAETVYEAAKRSIIENARFRIIPKDIRVYRQMRQNVLNICLLIDTSASMAGYRLQSAKFLAEHLVLSTRSKVSVIAFQEKNAEVFVPFTRSHSQLRHGLNLMNSFGLTPLAFGIYYAVEHIKKSGVKDPLLLLITDGIPTVPFWTSDPILDAVKASKLIAGEKLHFCCIGLQPNKKCLSKMVEQSGGSLYIVDELDKNLLATIAHKEINTHRK